VPASLAGRLSAALAGLLAVVAVLSLSSVDDALGQRRASEQIEALTSDVIELVELENGLRTVIGYVDGLSYAAGFGISAEVAARLIGVDLLTDRDAWIALTIEASERLGPASPIDASGLATATPDELHEMLDQLTGARAALLDELDQLTDSVDSGGFGLGRAVDDLRLAQSLGPSFSDLAIAVVQLLLPTDDQAQLEAVRSVVVQRARMDEVLDVLAGRQGEVGDAARTLADSDLRVRLSELSDSTVDDRLTTGTAGQWNPASLAGVLRDVWGGSEPTNVLADSIVRAATDQLLDAAGRLDGAAIGAMRRAALAVFLLIALGVVIAVWFVRSTVRPLGELESAARAMADGNVPESPAAVGTSRELRVTAEALNRLAAAFGLIQGQADALAAGDVEASILDERVPGRLGTSLGAAVSRLSDSIGESRRLNELLAHDAAHDALTGLANRRAAFAHLSCLAWDREWSVCFVDLDGFKRVNDAHGHDAGDAALCAVAERLADLHPSPDFVARIGGDEFLVVAASGGDADEIGREIVLAAEAPITSGGDDVGAISASVGVVVVPAGPPTGSEVDVDAVIQRADQAMYDAKASGRGHVEVVVWDSGSTDAGRRATAVG